MITCQNCGAQTPPGAAFCNSCGAALTATAAAQAQADAQAQLAAAHAARMQATAQQNAVHANPQFGTGRLPTQTLLNKRYLILKAIGRGGMAAVYQATDTRKNRIVAIKEMSQENLTPEELRESLESFRREAQLLQSLKHPNLPQVYEHFSDDGRHYLVMEFVDGETLEQKLEEAHGPLPEARTLGWARQLCDVLGYLHHRPSPIIFRDLKPANVMVTKKGDIKLIDFGIARVFSPRNTRDTQALGTPGYAPPEQYGNAQTDPRADIYALGATLYHLLSNYDVGRTPFALPPLRSRNPNISERTALAIERATRLDRAQRFNDTTEFARALGVGGRAAGPSATAGPQRARPTAGQGATQQRPAAGAAGATRQAGQRGGVSAAADTLVRAASAGVMAAGAAAFKGRMNPKAPPPTMGDLLQIGFSAARTATGGVSLVVQPREVDLGQLRAGQDGALPLTISGQNGSAVAGTLSPRAPWLHLDRTQFSGASTLVQVTARTSEIRGVGPQRTVIEVVAGSTHMYIPVRLQVIAAPGAAPRPQPQPQPRPQPQPQPRPQPQPAAPAGQPAGYAPQPRAATAMASQKRPQMFGVSARPLQTLDGLRLPLSLALALLLAYGLPLLVNAFARAQLTAILPSAGWVAWALQGLGVVGALLGALLAYIAATPLAGRLRTGALLALSGAALGIAFTAHWQLTPAWSQLLPGAAQFGALALTLPLLVSIGAALGVQPLMSRTILAIARYIAAHFPLVRLLAAIAGGWFGLSAGQILLSGIFQQAPLAISLGSFCGLVAGVVLGIILAAPFGYFVRRFAFG